MQSRDRGHSGYTSAPAPVPLRNLSAAFLGFSLGHLMNEEGEEVQGKQE